MVLKIVHVCLCGPVTDNWNYQENMLTKYQVKLGHDVTLVAPQWAWGTDGKLKKIIKTEYINLDGVKIIRLPIRRGKDVMYKFKKYIGLYNNIEKEKPDVIFIHNVQFLDIKQIALYAKRHTFIKVFVDNHADYSNSARNWIARKILYGVLWKHCAHLIEPYTKKFYGVLPSRVDFIKNIYKIPAKKVELLVMGADDELVEATSKPEIKESIRSSYGILPDDFLIVTGGKFDAYKIQILQLMKAINKIGYANIKLLIFGSIDESLKAQFDDLNDGKKIQYIGWVEANETYKYFASADLVIFNGRHSVFWEQVAGQGIPMFLKYWEGISHLDLGGNVKLLYNDTISEIIERLESVLNDRKKYKKMRRIAVEKGTKEFSYKNIAIRAIE